MENKQGGILKDYSILIIAIASTALAAVIASILIAVMLSVYIPLLISIVVFCVCVFFALQNRKITVDLCGVTVKYFLGAIKEQKYIPHDCGILVQDTASKRTTDIRLHSGELSDSKKKYIYLSEDILTEEKMKNANFDMGERIIIIEYSDELFGLLSRLYTFNCQSLTTKNKE